MARNDNYPDDIDSFNYHPQSPNYQAPHQECKMCSNTKDPEDMMTLIPEEDTDSRLFCSDKCLDEYINDIPVEVHQEMFSVIETLQSKLRAKA